MCPKTIKLMKEVHHLCQEPQLKKIQIPNSRETSNENFLV